jgi:thioredoxin reductase (NADPH)
MIYDVIIIGGGPAAYTAAIYAARYGLSVVVLEGSQPGGQLMITKAVENYPGFANGIDGPDLMAQMREQASLNGAELRTAMVNDVAFSETGSRPHLITVEGQAEILRARTVIIATGAKAKWLGIMNEDALMGKGVSACATCDGFFFRGKEVAVIGGGDTACEEADFLSKLCSKVTMILRGPKFRASKAMQDRVLANPKIEVLYNRAPISFQLHGSKHGGTQEDRLGGIALADTTAGPKGYSDSLVVEGAFVAIGHSPATEFLKDRVAFDASGYIKTDDTKVMRLAGNANTSFYAVLPGVFAAGDCADPKYRQAITAAGDGCKAARDARDYIAEVEAAQAANAQQGA